MKTELLIHSRDSIQGVFCAIIMRNFPSVSNKSFVYQMDNLTKFAHIDEVDEPIPNEVENIIFIEQYPTQEFVESHTNRHIIIFASYQNEDYLHYSNVKIFIPISGTHSSVYDIFKHWSIARYMLSINNPIWKLLDDFLFFVITNPVHRSELTNDIKSYFWNHFVDSNNTDDILHYIKYRLDNRKLTDIKYLVQDKQKYDNLKFHHILPSTDYPLIPKHVMVIIDNPYNIGYYRNLLSSKGVHFDFMFFVIFDIKNPRVIISSESERIQLNKDLSKDNNLILPEVVNFMNDWYSEDNSYIFENNLDGTFDINFESISGFTKFYYKAYEYLLSDVIPEPQLPISEEVEFTFDGENNVFILPQYTNTIQLPIYVNGAIFFVSNFNFNSITKELTIDMFNSEENQILFTGDIIKVFIK